MFYNFTLHHNHDNVSTIVAFEIQMLPSLIPDINSNYGDLINVIGVDCGHWTGTVDSLSIYKNSLIVAALLWSKLFFLCPALVSPEQDTVGSEQLKCCQIGFLA